MFLKSILTALIVCCAFVAHGPEVLAWSDAIEGVMMPSRGSEGNQSDADAVAENVGVAADEQPDNSENLIEWE